MREKTEEEEKGGKVGCTSGTEESKDFAPLI